MADNTINNSLTTNRYLKSPSELNWFDIKVIFDGKLSTHTVVEYFEESTDPGTGEIHSFVEAERYYGKHVPVLLFNNTVLNVNKIETYTLYYDDFVPYLHLVLRDDTSFLQLTDVPGMANKITLAMLPHADDKYKAIKLDFYIKNISYRGIYIICDCELQCMPIEKPHTQQLVFHWPSPGCTADHVSGISDVNNNITDCPLPPNKHPNTYELLHVIAEETGLGFAATDMCASVRDDKHRMLRNENYKTAIQKHVRFGGTDEDNIFDSWIDLYGYITMVNVPWVMTRKINIHNIAIHAEIGAQNLSKYMAKNTTTGLTQRLLTNLDTDVESNMFVEEYENMVDNNSIMNNGAINTFYDMNPMGASSGTNSISTKAIQSIENSLDGVNNTDMYAFEKVEYRGAEMGSEDDGNYPEMHQQNIHDKYFSRIRSKRIKVKMGKPNYGLMRGTLVGFSWWEFESSKKRIIFGQIKNAYEANKEKLSGLSLDDLYDNIIGVKPLLNIFVSGIYYIDGMIFEYDARTFKFTQYLILIKKDGEKPDMISNIQNMSTKMKLTED